MAGSGRPRLAWYGDDFTGSAAVMEVLAFAGLKAVLFSDVPSPALARRFADADALGIASTARSHGPEWMTANLPAPLAWLDATGAEILHYKICSTFDSSPSAGNIGRAIEIALETRASEAVPLVTAAPQMRRYQSFGHLYAGIFEGVFRLDRHPVMARHPVTPMDEADLLRHLARQTDLPSALIDLEALWSGSATAMLDQAIAAGAKIISLDDMEAASELAVGRLIWENRDRLRLAVGSQGLEYALVRHWQETGEIAVAPPAKSAGAVKQIAAISGSVSPSTARQIAWSAANGFEIIGFDAASVVGDASMLEAEIARASRAALEAISTGASILVTSAEGPDDPRVAGFKTALSASSLDFEAANARIGKALGRVLDQVLRQSGLRRAVISGGDTSGHGMRALGIEALEALAPTIPGAALSSCHSEGPHDGLQIALKGGQMGSEDFFGWIRDGGGPR
ncbi:four-carbon acid sugar kinase family protein [Pseudohoeflea suaedae]|uniref:Four-carbon acid sugar kinase family protein n=1 Tax=Pseudohoeflea suaedae TaxID=877384 RepID=A0A4R5PJ58_9HYPH|nr:four-carbon acid sugar kinase family protein [Pseudohoeflea suaedae]TDH34880.1 four-carbon acid sugar kinase family protein [Pseudohoeflea suaedae]